MLQLLERSATFRLALGLPVWLGLLALALPGEAGAIPVFARRYQTGCGTCHAIAYPELNPYGRTFKENGFQLPQGAEEAYRAQAADRPTGSFLDILREVPVAVRAQVSAQVQRGDEHSGSAIGMADLFVPGRLDLIVGGSVAPDVSVFATAGLLPSPAVHQLALGIHNLFAPGALNLRVGRFMLADFQRPEHRNVTVFGNPAQTVAVGDNPFRFDDHHTGVHAWGRPGLGRLFWEAAVVQGAEKHPAGVDLDLFKDLYLRTSLDVGAHRVGVFGYGGYSKLTSTGRDLSRSFSDPHGQLGVDLNLELSRATVSALAVLGRHVNPTGRAGEDVTYLAGRLQGDVALGERWLAIARVDAVRSPKDSALDRVWATGHLAFLVVPNVRLGAELSGSVLESPGLTGSLVADAAF